MAAVPHDQAFVFRERAEVEAAYSHGRAHVAGSRFLALLRASGGIWFDAGNRGFHRRQDVVERDTPPGCRDHNAGICAYTRLVQRIGPAHRELEVDR